MLNIELHTVLLDGLLNTRMLQTSWLSEALGRSRKKRVKLIDHDEIGYWLMLHKEPLKNLGLYEDMYQCYYQQHSSYNQLIKDPDNPLHQDRIKVLSDQMYDLIDTLEDCLKEQLRVLH